MRRLKLSEYVSPAVMAKSHSVPVVQLRVCKVPLLVLVYCTVKGNPAGTDEPVVEIRIRGVTAVRVTVAVLAARRVLVVAALGVTAAVVSATL